MVSELFVEAGAVQGKLLENQFEDFIDYLADSLGLEEQGGDYDNGMSGEEVEKEVVKDEKKVEVEVKDLVLMNDFEEDEETEIIQAVASKAKVCPFPIAVILIKCFIFYSLVFEFMKKLIFSSAYCPFLSVCLSYCLSVCLTVCLSVCLSLCLSALLSVYLSIYLTIYLTFCLLLFLYIYLNLYLTPPLHSPLIPHTQFKFTEVI